MGRGGMSKNRTLDPKFQVNISFLESQAQNKSKLGLDKSRLANVYWNHRKGHTMKTRKTIEVQALVDKVNAFMKNSDDSQTGERLALHSFLSDILMKTGNYHGYNYLHWLDKGCDDWRAAGEPGFPEKDKFLGDQTRTYFY